MIEGPNTAAIITLFPSGIIENRFRGKTVLKRILMWFTLYYLSPTESSIPFSGAQPPSLSLYIKDRSRNLLELNEDVSYDPYLTPSTPNTIASWSDDDAGGGLESYLWTYYLRSTQWDLTASSNSSINWLLAANGWTVSGGVRGSLSVDVFGQPTVDCKVARRLRTGDEIIFGITSQRPLTDVAGVGRERIYMTGTWRLACL